MTPDHDFAGGNGGGNYDRSNYLARRDGLVEENRGVGGGDDERQRLQAASRRQASRHHARADGERRAGGPGAAGGLPRASFHHRGVPGAHRRPARRVVAFIPCRGRERADHNTPRPGRREGGHVTRETSPANFAPFPESSAAHARGGPGSITTPPDHSPGVDSRELGRERNARRRRALHAGAVGSRPARGKCHTGRCHRTSRASLRRDSGPPRAAPAGRGVSEGREETALGDAKRYHARDPLLPGARRTTD